MLQERFSGLATLNIHHLADLPTTVAIRHRRRNRGGRGGSCPTKHFKGVALPPQDLAKLNYTRKQVIQVQKLMGLLPHVLEVFWCLQ